MSKTLEKDDLLWKFERCKSPICKGKRNTIGFYVPDEIWKAVVPEGINILCLSCFDEYAQRKGIKYKDTLIISSPITWEDND